jgi:hypothetical protein
MKTLDEEGKYFLSNRCCIICKHCFYTGLPGAYGCIYRIFTDIYDTCDKWEMSDEIGADDENAR